MRAESDSFVSARDPYEALWRADGARIVEVMERVSGSRFDSPPYADTLIGAIVFVGGQQLRIWGDTDAASR